ncbi:hypothetical protein CASFOL_005615 [Castilleja foliolosa]|uniref:NAB domain-containing protein n=1 Tax=Castilleja foliolosa TaxID=1961234 RepID=A0ABD3E4I6_9LAMI
MASQSFINSNKMKRIESKKSHSWWWDSHISPKNSKWLQENLEEMDQNVKRMLKLIEEDADSFSKKAELYFRKRPELISLVEEFYRIYRSLAERYDQVTGELRKNVPSDLQSQGSGVSDLGSEPPSGPARSKSGLRAAGFDYFLKSDKSSSDLNSKEGDESSTIDSESESDDSSVNNYHHQTSNSDELRGRVRELEAELRAMKEKLNWAQDENVLQTSPDISSKIKAYEDELTAAGENIRQSGEEITRLTLELEKYKSKDLEFTEPEEIQEIVNSPSRTIQALEEELRVTREEIKSRGSNVQSLQDQLNSAQKEVIVWKNKLEKEKREVSKLHDRMTRYKNNLSDREQEIRGLKEAISNANKALSEENEELKLEMTKIAKERAYLEDNLKELDLRCQSLEDDVRRVKAAKDEAEVLFGNRIEQLKADIADRDDCVEELNKKVDELKLKNEELSDRIGEMDEHLHDLHRQHMELIVDADVARRSNEEMRARVVELETEVERKNEKILEGADEKREAIRQLCLSIEYYRSGYSELRQAVTSHKRSAVMAA